MPGAGAPRTPAFALFTDLPKAGPYLAAVAARGLRCLVITGPPHWPLEEAAVSFVGKPGHPFEAVEQLAFSPADDLCAILDHIVSWTRDYDIQGSFNSSETFVEAAGQAADLLGLPGIGLRAARVCRNKHLQRRYLAEWSPVSVLSDSPREQVLAALADRYPVISKPLGLYCSIGIRVLRDRCALEAYLDQLAGSPPVLLEHCLVGREYSVETIMVAGRPVFAAVTQKSTNEEAGDYFVEMAHTLPAGNLTEEEYARLIQTQETVLARLDFGTGMAHGEYRILADGAVALMEIGARPPGGGLLQLYQLATGVSIESSVIDAALGRAVAHPEPRRHARQIYFDHEHGKLDDVRIEGSSGVTPFWIADNGLWPTARPVAADAPPGLRELLVLKARGAELGELTDSFGRSVSALFDAPDRAQLERIDAQVRAAVQIDVV